MRFNTAYVQTLGHQFQAMTAFAGATDLVGLQQAWPMVQKVLEVNGAPVPRSDELPTYDVDIPAFQHSILGSVRPNLNNAVIALLTEPSPLGLSLVKQTPAEQTHAINEAKILTDDASRMMMISVEIYLKIGAQFDVAASYFTLKTPASEEILWRMRMLFAVNNLSTDVLKMGSATAPHAAYAFSAALVEMIKPRLEPRLATLLTMGTATSMIEDHGITLEIIERAHSARLISSTTKSNAKKLLRPSLIARLGMIFGR